MPQKATHAHTRSGEVEEKKSRRPLILERSTLGRLAGRGRGRGQGQVGRRRREGIGMEGLERGRRGQGSQADAPWPLEPTDLLYRHGWDLSCARCFLSPGQWLVQSPARLRA